MLGPPSGTVSSSCDGPNTKDNAPTSVWAERNVQEAPGWTQPAVKAETRKQCASGAAKQWCLAKQSAVTWTWRSTGLVWTVGHSSFESRARVACHIEHTEIRKVGRCSHVVMLTTAALTQSIVATTRLLTSYRQRSLMKRAVEASHGR